MKPVENEKKFKGKKDTRNGATAWAPCHWAEEQPEGQHLEVQIKILGAKGLWLWEENHTSQSHGDGQKSLTKEPQASQASDHQHSDHQQTPEQLSLTCVVFSWIEYE